MTKNTREDNPRVEEPGHLTTIIPATSKTNDPEVKIEDSADPDPEETIGMMTKSGDS